MACTSGTRDEAQAGCSKSSSSKAQPMEAPEAHLFSPAHPKLPRQLVLREGYVEDAFEARTMLTDFFSILLEQWLLLLEPIHLTLQLLYAILQTNVFESKQVQAI